MRLSLRTTSVAILGMLVVSGGCATRAQLRRGLEAQTAALATERQERTAADQRLSADIARVQADVTQLRTDLQGLRTEFSARITQLENGMQFAMPVHFAFDDATVQPQSQAALDRFREVVQRHYPNSLITVEGFADPAGSAAYNRRLSQERAEAVREYLTQQGLLQTQVRAVGYGEDRPVVPGAAGEENGAELNRRVVFVVETPAGVPSIAPGPTTMAQ